jgi:hypothetical protein
VGEADQKRISSLDRIGPNSIVYAVDRDARALSKLRK